MHLKKVLYYLFFGILLCLKFYAQPLNHKARMDTMWNNLNDSTFLKLLDNKNLAIKIPESFHSVPVRKNYDIFYQYALAYDKDSFEVRFLLRPINVKQHNTYNIDIDDFCYSLMNITAMNASGGNFANMPKIEVMQNIKANKGLNVEWEARSEFNPLSEFGHEYVACVLYALRINDDLMLYYFLLFTDLDKQKGLEDIALQMIVSK